ncbi:MAG: SPFH domain-containing protein [Verrucomicrobiota bacterium]|nr:SPFH domain-containing protein [Verrucomicrobiota bacterium]
MNPKLAAVAVVAILVLFFGQRFIKTVPPGHVSVGVLFGEVIPASYDEGLHFPVNPLYNWVDYDTREKTLKEQAQVPTQDQLQTKVDISVQFQIEGNMAPKILQEVGTQMQAVNVYLTPKLRSLVREQGKMIARAEDFFLEKTQQTLETNLEGELQTYLAPKGINVKAVLIRDITLPSVLMAAIEQKKEREQAAERQKAELERFRTEQLQQVAEAEAKRQAAEEEAQQRMVLADARAFEIRAINKAIASNPAYIQLQALEALKEISKDPAAKLYFMDANSPQPLPLMNLGEPMRR